MFCNNCGKPVPDGARFCGNCGSVVSAAFSPPPDDPVMAVPPVRLSSAPAAVLPGVQAPLPSSHGTTANHLAPPPGRPLAVPAVASGYPEPPNLHWVVVLILSAFTYGLGAVVWAYRQAFFVRKLDPASKGVLYLTLCCAAMAVQIAFYFVMMSGPSSGSAAALMTMIMVTNVVIVIFAYIGIFGMRRSLVSHFNTVEPIGLRLGGVMTFFFSILYFQYHLSRIAAWRKTGVLK